MFFPGNDLEFNEWNDPSFIEKNITVTIARLDKIHPVISGNKLFKLYYFLEELKEKGQPVLTFGGAYSNHLVATAYACKQAGTPSIGIIRGENATPRSHTLQQCKAYGMQLHFISRDDYHHKEDDQIMIPLKNKFGDCYIIPEGGYHPLGAKGASLIMNLLENQQATHICSALGTATTAAGLLMNRQHSEKIIAVPVLKNMNDLNKRILFLTGEAYPDQLIIFNEYHFGGYAKKSGALISFMNDLYKEHRIPTDFVYTAKMLYAVKDKIKTNFFEKGSRIICLHTGGLQGNDSLDNGTLIF